MEKSFVQIQTALFFKNDFLGMIEKVSLAIKGQFGESVRVQILGIPSNAPSEIPRLIMNSELVDINLSKNRIDFFSKDKEFPEANIDKIFSIIENLSVKISRIGIVCTYFKELEIQELKLIFNQEAISNLNPNEISVRFNERKNKDAILFNNSQMYVSGQGTGVDGIKKNGVIITRDINTLPDDMDKNEFNKQGTKDFIHLALLEAERSMI